MTKLHFLDIGAWKGKTTSLLLKDNDLNIHAHLFEPNPILAKELREKFKDESRVVIYETALTNKTGKSTFFWDENTGEGASLYPDKKTSLTLPSIEVECMDAMQFIKSLSPGPIVFYSNCEGSEFEILSELLYSELYKRITLWSIAFHHGDRKIPSMKPVFYKLDQRMKELGIENVEGHFDRGASMEKRLEFVQKVWKLVP